MKKIMIAAIAAMAVAWFGFCYYFETAYDWEEDQKVTDYIDAMSYVDDLKELLSDDFQGFIYFGNSSNQTCEDIKFALMKVVRREKDLRVYNIDVDVWKEKEGFSNLLEKYQIESAPALIKAEENGKYNAFDGFSKAIEAEEDFEKDLQSFLLE